MAVSDGVVVCCVCVESMMAWELTNSGMSIGLGREIPQQIYSAIDDFALGLMRGSDAFGVEYADMRSATPLIPLTPLTPSTNCTHSYASSLSCLPVPPALSAA